MKATTFSQVTMSTVASKALNYDFVDVWPTKLNLLRTSSCFKAITSLHQLHGSMGSTVNILTTTASHPGAVSVDCMWRLLRPTLISSGKFLQVRPPYL